ncbi:MAG TPA: hypothetical protein VFT45_15810 [Longimicrobium sp.]|nr:hypothetical protein [Longimicrobium sp.]
MKKLRLDVDALKVDSFSPEAAPAARRGTVEGNAIEPKIPTGDYSLCIICPNTFDTCGYTENNTCIRTIHQTCICTIQTQPLTTN